MLRTIAYIFGVIFITIGILGFIPAAAPNSMLLGLFCVNSIHNVVHIATGVVAFIAGSATTYAARLFFRIFGSIYLLVAILGFFGGDAPVFGIIANNMPDVLLHSVIALVSLYLGFFFVDIED